MRACPSWIRSLPAGACCALVLLAPAVRMCAQTLEITVSAYADPAYVEASQKREYQTYHFYEGRRFTADYVDPSLEKVTFERIAQSVAEALKRNRYLPAKEKDGGDLLIVVSWGTTGIDQDWDDMLGVTDLGNSSSDVGDRVDENPDSWKWKSGYRGRLNERLLGYAKPTTQPVDGKERAARREDLDEERYFVILNAFDLAHMRSTGELRQVWSSRYSTQGRGTNFAFALDRLNQAAAPTFGQNIDGLRRETVEVNAEVKIGESEVLGYEETTSSSAATDPEAKSAAPAPHADKK